MYSIAATHPGNVEPNKDNFTVLVSRAYLLILVNGLWKEFSVSPKLPFSSPLRPVLFVLLRLLQ